MSMPACKIKLEDMDIRDYESLLKLHCIFKDTLMNNLKFRYSNVTNIWLDQTPAALNSPALCEKN